MSARQKRKNDEDDKHEDDDQGLEFFPDIEPLQIWPESPKPRKSAGSGPHRARVKIGLQARGARFQFNISVHPQTARTWGIKPGDYVAFAQDRGRIIATIMKPAPKGESTYVRRVQAQGTTARLGIFIPVKDEPGRRAFKSTAVRDLRVDPKRGEISFYIPRAAPLEQRQRPE